MTESATCFITPLTFQALSNNPVQTQLLDAHEEQAMGHIHLARWADSIIIAPATANMIAKLSYGLADDLVSTLCLAANCPIYIAPAMNHVMWHNVVTQENISRLQQRGMTIIGPEQGEQACGETGFGRMSEPEKICAHLIDDKKSTLLHGLKLLISAGPTREPLDPVRYITNRSSGKMGYALAEAALQLGATVTLVTGPVALKPPLTANVIQVETAEQMYQAIVPIAPQHDVYIGAAAVADYSPLQVEPQKIKKQAQESTITLQKTKDILAAVAALPNHPFVVGFAAETDDLENYAKGKLVQKNLDMIAANWVGKEQGGFEKDENGLHVFWHNGDKILAMTDKKHLAKQLLDLIIEQMKEKCS
jgi:phosphopantothenoylcysteine decarboxylase/phosphopantothenate--cysteine ligase